MSTVHVPMRIAIVSMVPAFPARAGHSVRILQMCRAIKSLGHGLTFIHVSSRLERQQPDDDAHAAYFGRAHYMRLDQGSRLERAGFWLRAKCLRVLRRLRRALGHDDGHRSGLDENWRGAWTRQLRRLNGRFDVVIVEYVFNSRALLAFPSGTRKLLDTHDAFADRHLPYVARGYDRGYWLSLSQRDECRGFRRADTILAIQQDEAAAFGTQLACYAGDRDPGIAVVSHFLDVGQPVQWDRIDHTALYIGHNMLSNQISLQEFFEHVLPRVLHRVPGFRLRIAGSICAWVPDHPNVDKLGFVEDLRDAFARAPLSINPTLAGTGINIKLLDAMCAGVPTISTATGARGLSEKFRHGVVVVPDHDHQAFADQIVRLSADADLRRELGQSAHADAHRWHAEQLSALDSCLRGME